MRNVRSRISKLANIYQMIGFLAFTFYFTLNLNAQNVAVSGADAATNAASPFATMAAAFTSINATAQTGNTIVISIIGNTTEPVTGAILNAGAWTSVSIQPVGGAARTITGAATGGLPLIDFNGADNVNVNGLNTGGNSLTIENTTVSAVSITSTIRFIADATSNTITNCILKGSVSSSVATNGAVVFFSTGTTTGNDNNTISNCDIGPSGANLPTKAILGNGSTSTTAIGNSGITINNNDIHDYFGAAVTSSGVATNGGCNTWSITNNRFYQTGTRTWTTGATHRAIDINNSTSTSGAVGFTITGNIIGYASNTQTGTYTMTGSTGKFQAIQLNCITGGTVSDVNNNTIASVSLTGVTSSGTGTSSPMIGILLTNGNVLCSNNTVGSQSATGSLNFATNTTSATDIYGIYNFVLENSTTSSNNIGGISVTNAGASGTFIIYGLRANTGTALTWACTSNIIGGNIANSIQLSASGISSQVIGIAANSAISNISQCTVRNLTSNIGTGTTSSASIIGISTGTSTTPNHTISQNTIHTLNNSNTSAATVVTGIQFTGSTSNVVDRNFIYGLTSATTSTSAEINGIRVAGGTTQYRNNMIALGAGVSNAIGASATNSSVAGIVGINEALGTNQFFHNSVYIGGTAAAGAGSSYAFNGTQTVNTRSFRNNIFMNARTNGAATGKHYAVKINGTTANPTGLTINNNLYFANGASGAVFGFFNSLDVANLAGWQTAVGQDGSSFESNPQLLDPTNAVPDLHIDPSIGTVVESGGVDLGVVLDYDGQTRSGLTPVDIGADAGDFRVISCTASVGGTISPSTGTRCANTTYTMTSSGASSGAGITFQWEVSVTGGGSGFTDVTGGTGGTTPSYTTGALSAGTFYYRLRVTCSSGPIVSYSNELTLTVNPIPTVVVSPTSGIICSPGGAPIALVASGADTYAWSPATGLSATTGASVTANPTTTTTYTVTGTTTATGCTNTATSLITVSLVPSVITVTPAAPSICAGDVQLLTATGGAPNDIIGSGTGFVGATSQPTAFCNRWPSYRGQQIYTAAELLAAGNVAGNITSLAFNVSSLGDGATNADYTVKIGHEGSTVNFPSNSFLSTTSYTTVYGPVVHTHTATGWQTITFSTPFNWDGVSNICVDIQHLGANATNNAQTQFTTTPGNTCIWVNSNLSATTGTATTTRLNIRFTPVTSNPMTWSPIAGLFTDMAGTVAYTGTPSTTVYASPASTQTYLVTATNGSGCTSTKDVVVTIASGVAIGTQPAPDTKCAGQTSTFTVVATGPGLTYQWRKDGIDLTDGGTISGSTLATLTITGVVSGDAGNYDVVVRSTCGSPVTSTAVALTVNPLPTVTVSPNSGTICSPGGVPIALVASGADTYAWSPATGLSATTGASVTANPSSSTTYTVTGTTTATGCINTATAVITIAIGTTISSVTATPATICSGENSQLQANASIPFNSMAYATGTGATLETIISPTTLTTVVNGSLDDGSNPVTPSPAFSFVFNGTTYTNFLANTNGWLRMGTTVPSSNIPSSLTSIGSVDAIFAFGRDANMNVTNGGDLTHGPAAGGKYVFQFTKNSGGASGAESATVFATMQIVLWGSTSATPGKIEIIYGAQAGTPASAGTIGIVNIANTFINAVNGSTSSTATATTYPITGTLYSFTPQTISYVWTPATFLSSTTIANPLASAVTETTLYSVTAALGSCVTAASNVTVNVSSGVAIGTQPAPDTKCAGQTSTFTVAASGPGLTYQWRKDGSPLANGGTISGATLSTLTITGVVSSDAGNYDVIVTSTCGSPLTSTAVALTVNPLPTVMVSPTSGTICSPGGTPIALGASGADTYAWSPAAGLSSATGASVTASPTTTTTYTVTGTTTATGCINTATTTITVNLGLTSNATATHPSVCTGDNSTLNAGAVIKSPIIISEVVLNRGGTGGGTYPAFAPGADLLEITNVSTSPIDISGYTISDYASNSSTISHPGFVFPASTILPVGGVAVVHIGPGTDDIPNRYYNTGGSNDSWFSSSLVGFVIKNGAIIIDAVGCGSGYVFNSGTGVMSSDWSGFAPSGSGLAGTTRTASIDNNIGADWSAAGVVTQTIGVFNAGYTVPPTISSFAWTPTTFLSDPTIANPVATALTSTTNYSVVVTASNGCTATSSVEVTVVSSAVINTQPVALSRCAGSDATFTVLASGPGLTYQWRKDGSPLSNGGTISGATLASLTITGLVAGDVGNYDVIVTATCGSPVTSNAVSLSVNPIPTVTASNDGPKCVGSDLNLMGTHIGGSTFAWTGPSGFSASTQNANRTSLTLAHSGTYTFTATSADGCTSLPATTIVTVNPTPTTITITPLGPFILCPSSPAELLTSNGGTISGTSNTIGSGTSFLGATSQPTAFCNRWAEYFAQQIYTVSELNSSGIASGSQLTTITFNINSLGDAATNDNYVIKIGHVGSTSSFPSTSFLSDASYTNVYGPVTHTHSASGLQTITFSTPFVWNGTDNICIQMSHSGADNFNNATTQFTAMPDNKTLHFTTSTIGGSSPTGTLTVNRLNIILGYQVPSLLSWTPTTGLFTDAAATIAYTGTSTNTVYAKPATTETYTVTSSSAAPVTFDGTITESAWGSSLATSAGGPTPGFGTGHEINALYVQANNEDINFGIAGDVQDGNRILLFIDSKTGGYVNGSFGRTGAPQGIDDFNSGTTFDAGFEADYCLVIGTNGAHSNFFFDLYTLSASGGPAVYLGDVSNPKIGADPLSASNTRGFELAIAKSLLGYIGGPVKTFAMYTSDGGFLSNQFLTRAGAADGNYGSGSVIFGSATPDPINVPNVNLNNYCTTSTSVTVYIEGTIVKNTDDAGFNSLRGVYNCINEGGTITYDQPTTAATVLTTPLNITKSVTIQGLSPASRPEITVPAAGVSIDATKTLTLQNVDVKSSGTATFTGTGDVSITGTTVGKQ